MRFVGKADKPCARRGCSAEKSQRDFFDGQRRAARKLSAFDYSALNESVTGILGECDLDIHRLIPAAGIGSYYRCRNSIARLLVLEYLGYLVDCAYVGAVDSCDGIANYQTAGGYRHILVDISNHKTRSHASDRAYIVAYLNAGDAEYRSAGNVALGDEIVDDRLCVVNSDRKAKILSDDLTLREMRFNSVNFKDGGTTGRREAFAQSAARTPHIQSERSLTHIVISNGDKTAALTPEKMTETEMKNICTNRLGMTEYQAEKAVAKSQKIDRQVKSKIEERTVGKDGVSQSIGIERTSQNGFTLTLGGKSKTYNFSTINVADKISRDFNIPKENSVHIIDKAKKQSLLQNKIHNSLKKQPAAQTSPKLKLNESKGLKH